MRTKLRPRPASVAGFTVMTMVLFLLPAHFFVAHSAGAAKTCA